MWWWHGEEIYVSLADMDPIGGTITPYDVINSDVPILVSTTLT